MSQTIEQAIAQAKSGAANFSQEANQNMGGGQVAQYQGGGAVAAAQQPGVPLGFDDLAQGQLNVAGWLKLSKFGMTIGTDQTVFDKFNVFIPLNEIAYSYSVRFGNPAQYRKSYDRVTDARGGSWMQTLAEAQRHGAKAGEFRSADIPFYPAEDIKSKTGTVLIPQGEAMGHSLTVTAWKPFAAFVQKLRKAGVDISSDTISLVLESRMRKNDKGEWGEFVYGDFEVVPDFPWNAN